MRELLLGLFVLAMTVSNLNAQVCATVNFISFECVKQKKEISKEKVYCKFKATNYQGKTKTRIICFQDFEAGAKEILNFDFPLCSDMRIELDLLSRINLIISQMIF